MADDTPQRILDKPTWFRAGEFERTIVFHPAYDFTGHPKFREYGRHGVEIIFYLRGQKGAVHLIIYTGWGTWSDESWTCMPADIGYHSPKPVYEGHAVADEHCQVIGGPCYYDGSGLMAQDAFRVLVREGGEALWKYLEGFYRRTFDREKAEIGRPAEPGSEEGGR